MLTNQSGHANAAETTFVISALGLRLAVAVEDEQLREPVRKLWTDCLSPIAAAGADFVVQVKGCEPWQVASDGLTAEVTSLPAAVATTCAAINITLATRTPLLAVHAAVLQKDGTTVVIPGESGAGKTTLTVALLQAGWSYASDESLALSWESAELFTYPRPLGISDWTAQKLGVVAGIPGVGERFLRAGELGAALVTSLSGVDHVVLLDRSTPVETPALRVAHRAEALEKLVHQGFTHYYDAERAVRLLADVVLGARTWRLRYGDPVSAATLLGAELAASPASV